MADGNAMAMETSENELSEQTENILTEKNTSTPTSDENHKEKAQPPGHRKRSRTSNPEDLHDHELTPAVSQSVGIHDLSNDLFLKIAKQLDRKSLLSASHVCKKWRLCINQSDIWDTLFATAGWLPCDLRKDGISRKECVVRWGTWLHREKHITVLCDAQGNPDIRVHVVNMAKILGLSVSTHNSIGDLSSGWKGLLVIMPNAANPRSSVTSWILGRTRKKKPKAATSLDCRLAAFVYDNEEDHTTFDEICDVLKKIGSNPLIPPARGKLAEFLSWREALINHLKAVMGNNEPPAHVRSVTALLSYRLTMVSRQNPQPELVKKAPRRKDDETILGMSLEALIIVIMVAILSIMIMFASYAEQPRVQYHPR